MKFKEYKVGDIFTQLRGKESAPNKVKEGNTPMINEISSNNGIAKYGDSQNVFPGNAITVSVNYAQNVFYQSRPFCASVNILILYNEHLTEKSGLYISSLLRKINKKYNYTFKTSKDRLNDEIITLPVKTTLTPDFSTLEAILTGGYRYE